MQEENIFLVGNLVNKCSHRIARKCVGTGGRCSVSGQKHGHPKTSASLVGRDFDSEVKETRVPDLLHIVGGQFLDHERKQNQLAKDDGAGGGDRQQLDAFEARISWVDTRVRQRNGEGPLFVEGVGQLWILPYVKKFDLV